MTEELAGFTQLDDFLRERFSLPYFVAFLMRTMVAANALLAKLRAPESGPLGHLPGSA